MRRARSARTFAGVGTLSKQSGGLFVVNNGMSEGTFYNWKARFGIKNPEDSAAEGAKFIADHIIRVSDRAFDDFVKSGADRSANRKMLGLEET